MFAPKKAFVVACTSSWASVMSVRILWPALGTGATFHGCCTNKDWHQCMLGARGTADWKKSGWTRPADLTEEGMEEKRDRK